MIRRSGRILVALLGPWIAAACTDTPSLLQLPGPVDSGIGAGSCADDTGCDRPLHCDSGSHACVACTSDDHCSSHLCDLTAHVCKACTAESECRSPTPHCDVDDRRCVQCTSRAQCGVNEVCEAAAHACAARCLTNADCAGTNRTICAVAAGVCVQCTSDVGCRDPLPFCELGEGSCVECLMNSDCAEQHCSHEHQCHTCQTEADCDFGERCVSGDCVY